MPKSRMDIPLHLPDHRVSKLYNKMKRKEATVAAIKYPLSTSQEESGWIGIRDADGSIICKCPGVELAMATYYALVALDAATKQATAINNYLTFDYTLKSWPTPVKL